MAQHATEFTRHLSSVGGKAQDTTALQSHAANAIAKAQVVQVPPLEQCRFLDDFNTPPHVCNARVQAQIEAAEQTHGKEHVHSIMNTPEHHPLRKMRRFDTTLLVSEMARLRQHGFMVSKRLEVDSFAEAYYRLYSDDMPVYITADSILHAWHRSFDEFLIDVEQDMMMPILDNVLRSALTECEARYNSPELDATAPGGAHARQLLLRIDFFLAIALSLLAGEESFGLSDNDARVTTTWQLIQRQEMVETEIFGATRHVDFSQFKPRGHYAKTKKLQHYFQAMMWVGTVDFRIAGGEDADQDLFQLQCALVLMDVLRQTHKLSALETLDACISSLAADGDVDGDCMSPMQFQALIPADIADLIKPLADVDSKQALLKLQATIIDRGFGTQAIAGHPLVESPDPRCPTKLPTSFALLGQRFVWSAFIFSKVVFDQVMQQGQKVKRRMPSALDAAFALFGNDEAANLLLKRMSSSKSDPDFVPFRDGQPYAANLVALRRTIDEHFTKAAGDSSRQQTESISTLWIRALRELSVESPHSASVFHSSAWKKRMMNTQLASLTQLRHDTVLYAKQSYTMMTRCEYAAGFVEPYPALWTCMEQLATRCSSLVSSLGQLAPEGNELKSKAQFFSRFATIVGDLKAVALAQERKQPLAPEQDKFLKQVMEESHGSGASRYLGWYPKLFYKSREDSGKSDILVVDVHTDTPSVEHGDPGGILHWGVGNVNFGLFIVDGVTYAGPVFSNYEFVTPINKRLDDDEFAKKLPEVVSPSWATDSFLCVDVE